MPNNKIHSTKAARACDACYDTVFPVIHPPSGEGSTNINKFGTIGSFSHLPSWLSMPSLPVPRQPHALMAIDTTCSRDISFDNVDDDGSETEERERKGRVRIKSHQRVRSYQQLLEDFQEQSHAMRPGLSSKESQSQIRKAVGMDDTFDIEEDEDAGGGEGEEQDHVDSFYTPTQSIASSPVSSRRKQARREDTARRSKRFSLPAIGLQTTVVTARTSIDSEEIVVSEQGGQDDLGLGLAAARLSELLGTSHVTNY